MRIDRRYDFLLFNCMLCAMLHLCGINYISQKEDAEQQDNSEQEFADFMPNA